MDDLGAVFRATAAARPDAPALIAPGETVRFGTLAARAGAFAAQLQGRGIGKGDRVLVAMGVGPDLYAVLAGLWQLGAVVVFPEPALGLRGVAHAVRTARPRALVASGLYRVLKAVPVLWTTPLIVPRFDEGSVPPATVTAGDPALISFTSGSTGLPKGIVRSHGFLMAQHRAVLTLLGTDTDPVDLVAFPVFVLVNLAVGRVSLLPDWRLSRQDRVDGAALARWITATGATRALLPPALCAALARTRIPPGLTTLFTGGGPVKPALVQALGAQRPDLRVVSVYGSTEAEPIAELDWAEVTEADLTAMATGQGLLAGRPAPGTDLRILDDEIIVAGAHVNEGYLDPSRDAETKLRDAGRIWHRTGDAGRLDAQGRLWLLGRVGAIVSDGNRRLYPFAVELMAEGWPGVRRAALGPGPALVIETDGPVTDAQRDAARALGIDRVVAVSRLPMDRRHNSKVDYTALDRLLRARV